MTTSATPTTQMPTAGSTPVVTTLSQSVTDTVEIEAHGALVFLQFSWADGREPTSLDEDRFAEKDVVDKVVKAARRKPGKLVVTALREVPSVTIFTDEGRRIFSEVALELVEYDDREAFFMEDDVARLLSDEELAARAYRYVGYDEAFVQLNSNTPANRVFYLDYIMGASGRYYDLPALEVLLAKHPWVLDVTAERGRPGGYDHVPAGLAVTVLLPDEVFAQICADPARVAARKQIEAQYTRPAVYGSATYAPSAHEVAEALFLAPKYADYTGALGSDPLGVAGALRATEYVDPDDDDSW